MTLNYAHRGASGYYPENTMLAFEKAVEMGCDGFETDVHLTRDGVAVLCHDEKIDRTTDGSGFIKDYSYSELQKFDAGIKFGKEFKDLRIPAMDELLQLVKNKGLYINLELKNDKFEYEGLEQIAIERIYSYGLQERVILSSFNHYSMVKCKGIDSSIKVGLLYDNPIYKPGQYGKYTGADALNPNYKTLKNEVIDNIKDNGLGINAYTVNDEEAMERLLSHGIDGIITNYPDRLNSLLKRR